MSTTNDSWPAGATWVFQGTVAEDATAGTHVCTLTVTPGAGNEMELKYGAIVIGATATAQSVFVAIDDGTNILTAILNAPGNTSNGTRFGFPGTTTVLGAAIAGTTAQAAPGFIVSGTQRLVLQVTTAAVSVTQTFAVVCRLKTSALPTATLADTVGTPTLTINTNRVF